MAQLGEGTTGREADEWIHEAAGGVSRRLLPVVALVLVEGWYRLIDVAALWWMNALRVHGVGARGMSVRTDVRSDPEGCRERNKHRRQERTRGERGEQWNARVVEEKRWRNRKEEEGGDRMTWVRQRQRLAECAGFDRVGLPLLPSSMNEPTDDRLARWCEREGRREGQGVDARCGCGCGGCGGG